MPRDITEPRILFPTQYRGNVLVVIIDGPEFNYDNHDSLGPTITKSGKKLVALDMSRVNIIDLDGGQELKKQTDRMRKKGGMLIAGSMREDLATSLRLLNLNIRADVEDAITELQSLAK